MQQCPVGSLCCLRRKRNQGIGAPERQPRHVNLGYRFNIDQDADLPPQYSGTTAHFRFGWASAREVAAAGGRASMINPACQGTDRASSIAHVLLGGRFSGCAVSALTSRLGTHPPLLG